MGESLPAYPMGLCQSIRAVVTTNGAKSAPIPSTRCRVVGDGRNQVRCESSGTTKCKLKARKGPKADNLQKKPGNSIIRNVGQRFGNDYLLEKIVSIACLTLRKVASTESLRGIAISLTDTAIVPSISGRTLKAASMLT